MNIFGAQNAGNLIQQADTQASEVKLRQLAGQAGDKNSQEGLKKAAEQFESVFLNTLMKAMRRTVPDNKLFNSSGPTKFYQQMQDAEMAKGLGTGHGGMGIADMIVRQFQNTDPADDGNQPTANHPPLDPLPPVALQRYRSQGPVNGEVAARLRLRVQAEQQGTAVADTLQRFENEITQSARDCSLDPALILAVVMEESGGDPLAQSPKGAQGLMQLMPGTAQELGVKDSTSPSQNIAGGSLYLSRLLHRYGGKLDLALAAYNAGPGNVDKAGGKVPNFSETVRYVDRVQNRYRELGGTKLANQVQDRTLKTSSGEMP
jgi:Rod binding domain-containing protein